MEWVLLSSAELWLAAFFQGLRRLCPSTSRAINKPFNWKCGVIESGDLLPRSEEVGQIPTWWLEAPVNTGSYLTLKNQTTNLRWLWPLCGLSQPKLLPNMVHVSTFNWRCRGLNLGLHKAVLHWIRPLASIINSVCMWGRALHGIIGLWSFTSSSTWQPFNWKLNPGFSACFLSPIYR